MVCQQVLSAIEEEHITKIMQAHANYMNEVKKLEGLTYEEMLQEARLQHSQRLPKYVTLIGMH